MIIENGTIRIKAKAGGGIDPVTHNPVKATEAWGEAVPCQWSVNKRDNLGVANGEHFSVASYIVLIDMVLEPPFRGQQLELVSRDYGSLGRYSIISVEPLDAVGQVRILI